MSSASTLRNGGMFLLRRLGVSLVTVFILAMVVFLMIKAIPGDEARVAAGESATAAQIAQVKHQLGLDQSLPGQMWAFFDRLLHGDLGTSTATHTSVTSGIAKALPETLELVVLASVFMILVAFPAATYAALHREKRKDVGTRLSVLVLAAVPTFWLALEAQSLLSTKWQIFPISGSLSQSFSVPRITGSVMLDSLLNGNVPAFWNAFQHYILPAFILMIPFCSALFRALRAEMISVLGRDHITVARAKGLGTARLVMRHALPNALGPALTIIGIEFGSMVGAAVLVEAVFGLNGMGAFLTTAVGLKDTFSVLAGVLVVGTIVVTTSFVVDVFQMVRDPRIRAGQAGV
ncbi:ABC transporter permease [Streptomyces sp. NPDC046821]|uniref:ABC transporter permease n=1 Tax=Streptomyces sp. NPDC046821 TaxID=3154702 RepID=UPI0033FCC913